jgi:DNA-binding NarL/FixJ family response regulator
VIKTRRVLVVENETLLRDLLARMLESEGFVVETAESAATAKQLLEKFDPDALVIDIDLGLGPNGFDLADSISRSQEGRAIVFLTNLPDPRFSGTEGRSLAPGAAYLRKSSLMDSTVLLNALNAALTDRVGVEFRHDLSEGRPLANLSASQLQVLKLVAQGKSNVQIAEARNTSVRAVEALVSRVFSQLDLSQTDEGNLRVEAAIAYIEASGLKLQ